MGDPLFSEPADEARTIGDEGLLEILEAAIADERAAQAKYRRGLRALRRPAGLRACSSSSCATSRRTSAPCVARYAEVKKRLGLSGAGRRDD